MRQHHTFILLSILILTSSSGCIHRDAERDAENDNMPAEELKPQPPQEATFQDEWPFTADFDTNQTIEFRAAGEMSLDFSGILNNFIGSYVFIELPMGCGNLADGFTSMYTTIESERPLRTIKCFVHTGIHTIHIETNGVAEGTIYARAAN